MPDRSPFPAHWPPSRLDHALSHPGEVVAACWWVGFGLLLLVSTGINGCAVSPTLASLDSWVPVTVGSLLVPGGALTVWGLVTTAPRLSTVWTVLRVGLTLGGGGWAVYSAILIIRGPAEVAFGLGGALTHVMIAGLTLASVVRAEVQIRRAIDGLEE